MTSKLMAKRFFEVTAMLLAYEPTEEVVELKGKVLALLCEIYNVQQLWEECEREIGAADIVQICNDGVLMENTNYRHQSAVTDCKIAVLAANQIDALKSFEWDLFAVELRQAAYFGQKSACALLACLNWIGVRALCDRDEAIDIWKELAVSGDEMGMTALLYACGVAKKAEDQKWKSIAEMLRKTVEDFSPIVRHAGNEKYGESELQLANLILSLRRNAYWQNEQRIDRAMLYYVMNSKDDYLTKMHRIGTEKDFYPLILEEDGHSGNKIGF